MIRLLIITASLWVTPHGAWAATVVDRVAATVNRQAILQSDVEDEIGYERFMTGQSLREVSEEERKAALERLIDRELLRQQMRENEVKPPAEDEIKKQIDRLKAEVQNRSSDSWEAELNKYGITEDGLRKRIVLEFEQLRLVDARLRPSVQIEPVEVQKYYREQFLPKLLRSGAQQVNEAEAAPKIREILMQEKVNHLLNSWLETLRSQADVKVLAPRLAAKSESGAGQ